MKQKQTLLKILLLTPVLAGLLSLATFANAASGVARFFNGVGEVFTWLIGTILGFITMIVANIVFPFAYLMINSLIENGSLFLDSTEYVRGIRPADITQQIWNFSLGIANGIFLLALIIISVAIILRIDTKIYNIKKVLGGLIAAIILSNMSLLIVKTALAIGDQLTIAATSLLGEDIGAPSNLFTDIYNSVANPRWQSITSAGADQIIYVIATIILLGITLKIVFILFQRMIWIFFLLISAPVAFALSILPATQEYAAKWWSALLKWVLVLPLVMLMLTIAKKVIDASGGVGTVLNWIPPDPDSSDVAGAMISPRLLIAIAGLAIMYFAGQVDKAIKLGAISASSAYQSVSKGISDTIGGKSTAGKIGRGAYDSGKREAKAGAFGKTAKGWAIGRQAKWDRSKLNPQARKAKQEADNKRRDAFEIFTQDAKEVNTLLKPLDDAAHEYMKEKGEPEKDWYDLNNEERGDLLKKKPGLETNKKQLGDTYGTMMWRARKFAHETNIADLDPVTMLEQKLLDPKTDLGEGIVTAINLSRIATSNNHPEKVLAQETLTKNEDHLQKKYAFDTKKLIKIKPSKIAHDSDLQLMDAQKQSDSAKTEITKTQNELSRHGLNKKMAEKIVEEGVFPPEVKDIATTVNKKTLSNLMGKELRIEKNSRRIVDIENATKDSNEGEIDHEEVALIIDMVDSGISIQDMQVFRTLDERDTPIANIQDLLKKLSSAETSQQESEKTISVIENIHHKDKVNVERAIKRSITTERQQIIHDTVTASYNNIFSQVEQDRSIIELGDLNLTPNELREIREPIDEAQAGLGLNKDTSKILAGDALHTLRIIRDATAKDK